MTQNIPSLLLIATRFGWCSIACLISNTADSTETRPGEKVLTCKQHKQCSSVEKLTQLASVIASVATIIAPPAAVIAGAVPRAGPLRALALGLHSRFFRLADPLSLRVNVVDDLRLKLSSSFEDQYVVVAGPKGVGKTCIVNTATSKTCGVVSVRVPPATPEEKIKDAVFRAISRCHYFQWDLSGSAHRVLWWHRFIFRMPVTVILEAVERKGTQAFSDLDSAARGLSQDYGIRVVIDASNNSLPEAASATKRQRMVEVPPMPRDVLEQLPELGDLHAALKTAGLADIVWACLGGVPADYSILLKMWTDASKANIENVVMNFLQGLLKDAIENRSKYVASNAHLEELYSLFRHHSEVPLDVVEEKKFVRPSPDCVLRTKLSTSSGRDQIVLFPADAATALVLRFGLKASQLPNLPQLRELLRLPSTSPPSPPSADRAPKS